ncbi:MAG: CBS domain-containing protein [Proteobacteria bacterium]|nr:CBS domain-containing protein [Pseudomonadota bacterium]
MGSAPTGLIEEVKLQSPQSAAEKLAHFGGAEVAAVLARLSPGFAQEILAELPAETRERALAAAPLEYARQWQRNALYAEGTIGRMMEPVYAEFPPQATVGQAIEALHELVKTAFITYIYVVDDDERLLGIVTMRDLLFNEHAKALRDVMLTEVFSLHAPTVLENAMKQVLDRHYPVYPVVDAENRLRGLVAAIGMYVTANSQGSKHPLMLAFVVFMAMVVSCVASGLSGAMVPLTLKRLGFDPATASSIFLTTATDVVSMGLLLGLATLLIR